MEQISNDSDEEKKPNLRLIHVYSMSHTLFRRDVNWLEQKTSSSLQELWRNGVNKFLHVPPVTEREEGREDWRCFPP